MAPLDCLFIGKTALDILLKVDQPSGSGQCIMASDYTKVCGGIASTSSAVFKKLGYKTGLITITGDDEFGVFVQEELAKRDLDYRNVVVMNDQGSPFSVILVEEDGECCIAQYQGSSIQLEFDTIDANVLANTEMVHMGGLNETFMAELAENCKKKYGLTVSVDGKNLSKEGTDKILPYADIFILDDKTVAKTYGISPEESCRYYHSKGAKIACVTMGHNGAVAFDGKDMKHVRSIAANTIDTTGAGDSFQGAFLFCKKRNMMLEETLRFCNTVSGIVCEALGGNSNIPAEDEVLARMAKEMI